MDKMPENTQNRLDDILNKTFELHQKEVHTIIDESRTIGQKEAIEKTKRIYRQMSYISFALFALILIINFVLIYFLFIRQHTINETFSIIIIIGAIAISIFAIFVEGRYYQLVKSIMKDMNQEAILSQSNVYAFKNKLTDLKSSLFSKQLTNLLVLVQKIKFASDEDKAYISGLVLQSQDVNDYQIKAASFIKEYQELNAQAQTTLDNSKLSLVNAVETKKVHLPEKQLVFKEKLDEYEQLGGKVQQTNYSQQKDSELNKHHTKLEKIKQQIKVVDTQINQINDDIKKRENNIDKMQKQIEQDRKTLQNKKDDLNKEMAVLQKKLSQNETSTDLEYLEKEVIKFEKERDALVKELASADADLAPIKKEMLDKVLSKISIYSDKALKEKANLRTKREDIMAKLTKASQTLQVLDKQGLENLKKADEKHIEIKQQNQQIAEFNHQKNTALSEKEKLVQKQLDESNVLSKTEAKYDKLLAPFISLSQQINDIELEITEMKAVIEKTDDFKTTINEKEQTLVENEKIIKALETKQVYFEAERTIREDLIDNLRSPYL